MSRCGVLPLLLCTAGAFGCATYTLQTIPQPQHDMPHEMFGLAPGPTTIDVLRRGGWALADTKEGTETYLLADPAPGVTTAEAIVKRGREGRPIVKYLRLRYSETRLATYRELVNRMLQENGPPQSSEQVTQFELFDCDSNESESTRPSSFVVHRWTGKVTDLMLVAGIEAPGVIASSMQYQVFLLPHGAVVQTGEKLGFGTAQFFGQ